MTATQKHYIAVETTISVAINVLISIGFAYLFFANIARIALRAMILDAVPQTVMIALMSTIVPTLLTRRRLRAGAIVGLPDDGTPQSTSLPIRVAIGVTVALAIGVGLTAVLLPIMAPAGLNLGATLAFKAIYGGALALVVTPIMLGLALKDRG